MKVLDDIYESVAKNKKRWLYYKKACMQKKCNLDLNRLWIESPNAIIDFIIGYFTVAGKDEVVKDFNNTSNDFYRGQHIISTFILGIRIAEILKVLPYRNKTSDVCDPYNKNGFNFLYYWFLSCLYHDIGYAYEDFNTKNCKWLFNYVNLDANARERLKKEGLNAAKDIFDLKYMPDFKCDSIYSRGDIDIYFKGRATGIEGIGACIDHGIIGGLMLYDKLVRQYYQWKEETGATSDDFRIGKLGLHTSKSHFKEYEKAANAIIAHNIWIETLNKYKEKDVKYYDAKNRISFQKDPLCFILCLADTIEPLKKNIGLNCIKLGCCNEINSFIIEISADVDNGKEYINCVKDLNKWLNVTVSECGDCRAIISVGRE